MKSITIRLIPAVLLLFGFFSQSHAAELVVSVASSLTNAFKEIGQAYEGENSGTKVLFNFGASDSLLQQISRGAPVDVFASADQETMDRASKQQLILTNTRSNFVENRLVLVVPIASDPQVIALPDLTKEIVQHIGVGAEAVPVGRYTKEFLEKEGMWNFLVPKYVYGQNVRQVLDYVARGEVEAGFVYLTDALLFKDKVRVVLEATTQTPIVYPIAVVKGGGNEKGGHQFVAFVRSEKAQAILQKYGFQRAPK
jgi:molybdate transport system substrate-binding protein